jgi:hypothetical protein
MTDTLETLSEEWLAAKAVEKKATADRVAIEDRIIALTGKRDEGSQTHKAEGFSIEVKGVINRKMDWKKWAEVKDTIPPALRPVKLKEELDIEGVKYLQANEPDIYALLPITATPGKTGITVERK